MTDREHNQVEMSDVIPDDPDRALITSGEVESAGRSCVVIIALAIVIVVLIGIWIVYTTS